MGFDNTFAGFAADVAVTTLDIKTLYRIHNFCLPFYRDK